MQSKRTVSAAAANAIQTLSTLKASMEAAWQSGSRLQADGHRHSMVCFYFYSPMLLTQISTSDEQRFSGEGTSALGGV